MDTPVIDMSKTGRVFEYQTVDSEKGLMSSSSFVHIQRTGRTSHPLVEHIHTFKHLFIGGHTFAKVAVYDHITEDCDFHLWFVPDINTTRCNHHSWSKASNCSQNWFWILDSWPLYEMKFHQTAVTIICVYILVHQKLYHGTFTTKKPWNLSVQFHNIYFTFKFSVLSAMPSISYYFELFHTII